MWFMSTAHYRRYFPASGLLIAFLAIHLPIFLRADSFEFCHKDGCPGASKEGHLKPFGQHKSSEGEIPSLKYAPSGADFYHNFIHQRKPVLLRGGANNWPSVENWGNISYLATKFGSDIFTVEYRKHFKNEFPVRKPLQLSEFLKIFESEDVYLDSAFPPSTAMVDDIFLPSFLNCHEISSKISNLNLLLNSGNASSAFHHDGYENVLTVVSGTKKVFLVNSSSSEQLYADQFKIVPGVLPIDPEKMDLETYPMVAEVPFYEVTLNKGDMLYIPQYWWHFVRSYDSPNIALNIWFEQFNFDDQFHAAGLSEDTDVSKVTELFDKLVKEQPDRISCQEEQFALNAILKINTSDPSSGPLRIPKQNERPRDVKLASGYTMPVMGFGTATLMENTIVAVKTALEVGYRMIDTAQGYADSEPQVAKAIAESGIPRQEVFIMTKLHPKYLGYEPTLAAIEMSLQSLKTDYIDMFLIHSQFCDDFFLTCEEGEPKGTWQESWKAMEEMHKNGKLRSLGVSNFDVEDLKELVELASVPVSAVQNWFDPFHQDKRVRTFCQEHSIRYIGYSTLGTQWVYFHGLEKNPVLHSNAILEISSHYEFVASQVVLRWAIHVNVTVIPRSKNPRNIQLNFRALDFSLNQEEIEIFTNITDYEYHPLEKKFEKGMACLDKHSNCEMWANVGECQVNPDWMLINCQQSCGLCFDENLDDFGASSSGQQLVIVGSEDHYMYALSAAQGHVVWKYRTLGKLLSTVSFSLDGETIYFGSNSGTVYALSAANGTTVWTYKTEGAVVASPRIGKDGTVYVGSHDKFLYALAGKTGSVLWKKDLQCFIWAAVAIDDQRGLLFAGCATEKTNSSEEVCNFFAIKSKTGEIAWKFEKVGNIYGSPACLPSGQSVFFASLDHHIYAVDRDSGKLLWSYDSGSEIESSPVVSKADGTLYVGLIANQLIALNTMTGPQAGKLKWSVNTGGEVVATPVITEDGRVFVGSGDGRVLALNQTDGSHIWSPTTRDFVTASVVVSRDNVVFAASADHFVYALHGNDGTIIWKFETGAPVTASPALAPEQTMPVA